MLFLECSVVLRQIGWREELKTAARSYGQKLSLAMESNLLRQQRERAPSFYRIPLPGGGVLTASLPHICGKKGKIAEGVKKTISSKEKAVIRVQLSLNIREPTWKQDLDKSSNQFFLFLLLQPVLALLLLDLLIKTKRHKFSTDKNVHLEQGRGTGMIHSGCRFPCGQEELWGYLAGVSAAGSAPITTMFLFSDSPPLHRSWEEKFNLFSLQFSVLDAVILYTVFCLLYCLSPVPAFPSQGDESSLLAKTPDQTPGLGGWTFCLAALRALDFKTGLPNSIKRALGEMQLEAGNVTEVCVHLWSCPCWGAGPRQWGRAGACWGSTHKPQAPPVLVLPPALVLPLTSCRLNSLNYCCLLQGMTCQKSEQPCATGARGASPPRSPPAALPLYKAKKLIL
ncbi:hypothetical protein EK904_009873 [Melospiza melodia maxima]|nr:hypothetical protein EK904_009873 [Melospiza melodia maxima]